jgi:betaine-aldehyde dehydrogenase
VLEQGHQYVDGAVVLLVDTDGEGTALAHDTPFGPAASAWSRDTSRTLRASLEIQAGCAWIDDHMPIISEVPHGGYVAPGFGTDMSQYSFDEHTQVEHVSFDITAEPRKDWHRTNFGDR